MKFYWLRFLLLSTFVFWATGAAKYTHEAIEHHGRDASVVDDDDDDDDSSPAIVAAAIPVTPDSHNQQHPAKHPCPVCQMLAAMVVAHSAPPALPSVSTCLIATLIIGDRVAPTVHTAFSQPARGPPAL